MTSEPNTERVGAAASEKRAWLNLPWYVEGKLGRDAAAEVEHWLEASPRFQAEARLLRRLATEVRDAPLLDDAMAQGFARLRAEVAGGRRASGSPGGGATGGWRRALAETPVRIRALIGLQAAAIACGLLLLIPAVQPEPPAYALLATEGEALAGPAWRVRLAPDATEPALRAVLLREGLRITGGPTETGVYTLVAQDADASPADVTDRLRAAAPIAFAVHRP